jgi:hypothetical protein
MLPLKDKLRMDYRMVKAKLQDLMDYYTKLIGIMELAVLSSRVKLNHEIDKNINILLNI